MKIRQKNNCEGAPFSPNLKSSADCDIPTPNLTVGLVEDLENLHEQVYDVQVKLDGGEDVFLLVDTAHDHLGVINNEKAEQNGAKYSQTGLGNFSTNKQMNKRSSNKDHESRIQGCPKTGEVTLGLKCESCESSHNSGSQDKGLKNYQLVEKCDRNADSVRHDNSECSKQDKVNRMLLPFDMEGHQESKRQEKSRH